MQEQAPNRQLEMDITRLEKEIESYTQEKFCYEAQILRVCLSPLNLSFSPSVWLAYKTFWNKLHIIRGESVGYMALSDIGPSLVLKRAP